jgi:sugar lactone lactonase YvrE
LNTAEDGSYDPESKKYGVDTYKDESQYLSTIALRKDAPGVCSVPSTPSSLIQALHLCISAHNEVDESVRPADTDQFIATLQHDIVLLPAPSPLSSTSTSPNPTPRKVDKKLSAPLPADPVRGLPTRFNDGAAAPDGSFWVGSMTIPEVIDGSKRGELWRYAISQLWRCCTGSCVRRGRGCRVRV